MKTLLPVLVTVGVILAIVLIGVAIVSGTYNSMVSQSQAVDAQWAQVETQYQRRYDLIPNLVNAVKGGMAQERAVFDAIAEARTRYAGAPTPDARAAAASQVEGSLARLLVVMENYPQIRSLEAVQGLMAELAGTENRISVERRRFNETVQRYNTSIKTFPTVVFAGMFGFKERAYFQSVTGAATAPKVEF
ncbi:MAG: LemA family protein [Chloroflexota bacterium]